MHCQQFCPLDLASSSVLWLKLWIQMCNMANLYADVSMKQKLFYFIVCDTLTAPPYLHHVIPLWTLSADTCGFSRLTLCSWYLVVVQQNVTFMVNCLSKNFGSFLWLMAVCLPSATVELARGRTTTHSSRVNTHGADFTLPHCKYYQGLVGSLFLWPFWCVQGQV